MARPPIHRETIVEINLLRAKGLTLDQILDQMNDRRNDGSVDETRWPVPSRNTVAKYMKMVSLLDAPFEWHSMPDYGLPWEAGSFLLEMWHHVVSGDLAALVPVRRRLEVDPNRSASLGSDDGSVPSPTVRQARWWWSVHLALPELNRPKNLVDVLAFAQPFVVKEMLHDLLGEPLDLSALEAHLAFKPWASPERLSAYVTAYESGSIPGRHASEGFFDAMRIAKAVGIPGAAGVGAWISTASDPETLWRCLPSRHIEQFREAGGTIIPIKLTPTTPSE